MENTEHFYWITQAAALSREGMEKDMGGPFGAVIVQGNELIGTGQNQVTSRMDPTAHAEVVAIRNACQKLGTHSLQGCRIYTSCEPCPMCLSAIYWARLDEIFFANTRDQAAAINFDDAFLYNEVPLPIDKRTKPTTHLACTAATAVFSDWLLKDNRIPY